MGYAPTLAATLEAAAIAPRDHRFSTLSGCQKLGTSHTIFASRYRSWVDWTRFQAQNLFS